MLPPSLLMPLMRRLDPETAHNLSLTALRLGLAGADTTPDDPILETRAFGRTLKNPIGLAAGFDKNAAAVNGLGAAGLRLRRGRHRHAPPAARQPQAAPVPPDRGQGGDQPHGLQ